MATTIKLKNSVTTTNAPSSLVQGEVAINITDKKVWVGNAATTPIQLLGDGGSASFTSIAFGAGTVSSPSITFTGDTNTGIYSPAADTIAFTEGGVESMRIDSSGNVGIGTSTITSSGGWSPRLVLAGTDTALVVKGSSGQESTFGTSGGLYIDCLGHSTGTSNNIIFRNTSTNSSFSSTERMRIDSSGNVGIGASSFPADTNLTVLGNFQTGFYRNVTSGGRGYLINIGAKTSGGFADGAYVFGAVESGDATGYLTFGTRSGGSTSERMRITSGGEVYIAGTTDQGAYNLQCNGTGVWGAGAYVNGSDERIKDNIAPLDSGLDVVAKLNPVTYKYKENWSKDQSTQTGFIAQELLTALDGKNYVDGVVQQGGEYMSVAYQNIIPILTKAIQEQQAMIEELTNRIKKLEGV